MNQGTPQPAPLLLLMPVIACRAIGVMNKKDDTVAAKEEKEEEEHRKGIAKHDVFGMSIKAKDVGDDGDVRAIDKSLQVRERKHQPGEN